MCAYLPELMDIIEELYGQWPDVILRICEYQTHSLSEYFEGNAYCADLFDLALHHLSMQNLSPPVVCPEPVGVGREESCLGISEGNQDPIDRNRKTYNVHERRQAVVSLPAARILMIWPLNAVRSGVFSAIESRKTYLACLASSSESRERLRLMIWSAN